MAQLTKADHWPSHIDESRVRKARIATFFGFFQLGAMILVWSTSTTPLRESLGWVGADGDGNFGLLALSIGVGAATGSFLIGPFLDRLGPRKTTGLTLVAGPLFYIPLAFVSNLAAAMLIGVLIGLLRGAQDTAVNAHGIEVERFYGRSIMTLFHAAYPVGGFIFGMVGSAFAQRFIESPAAQYIVLGVVLSALGLFFSRWMLEKDETLPEPDVKNGTSEASTSRSTSTLIIMVGFGVLLLCSMLSEGATLDWGQEFVRRHADTTAGLAGLAVSLYSGAQLVGRLFGDQLAQKFGARIMVGASGLLGMAGSLLALLGANAATALAGFVLIGLGLANFAPLMLSAAGRRDPDNVGRNIGIVNALGYSGMLIGPGIITILVTRFGITSPFILVAVLMGFLMVTGPMIMKFSKPYKSSHEDSEPGATEKTVSA